MNAGARALIRRSAGRLPTRQRIADYEASPGTSRKMCVARSLVPDEGRLAKPRSEVSVEAVQERTASLARDGGALEAS